ncbi:MAG: polyhydroxyalkanoate synthase [Myxococcota bacterium]
MIPVLLLLTACLKAIPPSMEPAAQPVYRTQDGWQVPLRRYPADGPPVVLVHGLNANHRNFDHHPDVSLADHLQDEGFDVWVVGLRGDPGSVPPHEGADGAFDFDDHARLDLPAALDVVQETTGAAQVYWVGHSMGGILLYAAMNAYPERIAAGVAVSSPATFTTQPPLHRIAKHSGALLRRDRRQKQVWMARFASVRGVFISRIARIQNMDPAMTRGLKSAALVDVPTGLSRQAMLWLKTETLVTAEGEPWLTQPGDVPLLVLGGEADHIVPADNARAACTIFPDCRFITMDPAEGFSTTYGHIDPLLGITARSEIYPVISGFLAEQHRLNEETVREDGSPRTAVDSTKAR